MFRDQEMNNWDNVPMGHPWSQEKNDFARLLLRRKERLTLGMSPADP